MNNMIFYDERHETSYNDICNRMKYLDCCHRSLAYLLALDVVLREHIEAVYDFQEDGIKRDGLLKAWQTSTSAKVTRLAFNLWNSCCSDGTGDVSPDGYDLPQAEFLPNEIFCDSLAEYFFEAIKLRYPQYFSVEHP